MFATKILVASAIAASSMAFSAAPANAATHIALSIGIPAPVVTYYAPAPVTYVAPAPVVTYVAPAPVCSPPVVVAPAPVIVYDRPGFFFRFGHDWHHDGFRFDHR